MDKKQKEAQIPVLSNNGNFLHNSSVLQEGHSNFCISPTREINPYDYLPCQDCYGYYAESDQQDDSSERTRCVKVDARDHEQKEELQYCTCGQMRPSDKKIRKAISDSESGNSLD